MHEYSLVRALADQVEQHARAHGATAVSRVAVRIGALSGVEPQLFASAFTLCREGVLAEAELDIQRSEAAWACPECEAVIPAGAVLRCAACERPAKLVSGDEILLEQIEMEVPETGMEVP
jgi:hydrogenase nickel incorporation protein HypA/HybF